MLERVLNTFFIAFAAKFRHFPLSISVFVILALVLASSQFGCNKDKDVATAIITVNDEGGNPVGNVPVRFYVESEAIHKNAIDTTLLSNGSGEVRFTRPRECILDVFAKNTQGATTRTGETTIWMKLDETTTDTITIR